MPGRPVRFYDANVLYSAQLRDFLMRLALGRVVKARWSERVHEEWMRNVHADYSDITKEDLRRIRNLMDEALPDAVTEGYEDRIEDLSLPDPSDRHVLAAAIEADADYIVTFNDRDFPASELRSWDIDAIGPDELVSDLFDPMPDRIVEVARMHRHSLTRPSKTPEGYLEMLRNCGLERTARLLEEHMARI
jgi:predicted nucleic acid-binding protein